LPSPKTNKLQKIVSTSLFLNELLRNIPKFNIYSVAICPAKDNYYLRPEDLIQLLEKIKNPLVVRQLYLFAGWMSLGDPVMVDKLCTFTELEELYLKGKEEDGVLHGFSNRAVKKFARVFHKLKYLYIDGMGCSTFNFKALALLLKANPNLKVLKIAKVSGIVDFEELQAVCPKLEKLIIEFTLSDIPGFRNGTVSNALLLRLQREQTIVPLVTGKLSGIHSLRQILLIADSEEVRAKADSILLPILGLVQYGTDIDLPI
jgi:hypothetical protein